MRVLTYKSTDKIIEVLNKNNLLEIPHLCASQTLAQGMRSRLPKNKHFINTIDNFLDYFYGDWLKKTELKIKQYTELSEILELSQMKESIRESFKRDQRELLEAIRLMKELDFSIDDDSIEDEELRALSHIYNKTKNKESFKIYDKVFESDSVACLEKLNQLIDSDSSSKVYINKNINRIIIHGLFQFSPKIINMINHLEKVSPKIEVIFLIYFNEQFPSIYKCWSEIYSNFGLNINDIEKNKSEDRFGRALGSDFGNIFEGKRIEGEYIDVRGGFFANMTELRNYISNIYKNAKLVKENSQPINKRRSTLSYMREHFYAPDNSYINDLLKSLYPEQFKEKHFLAYPIGQFILTLYNMRDENNNTMKVSIDQLKECLSIFSTKKHLFSDLNTLLKVETYLGESDSLENHIKRLEYLLKSKQKYESIKESIDSFEIPYELSFFAIEDSKIIELIRRLQEIKILSERFFNNNTGRIDFKAHFRELVNWLRNSSDKYFEISSEEKMIIEELLEKLSNTSNFNIEGTLRDLKESIHYYLAHERKTEASWIVRNFEQLDGGVILANNRAGSNKRSTFHFILMSDNNILDNKTLELPWPLNKKFLKSNCHNKTVNNIYINTIENYDNFLRTSLFYAFLELKNESIKISYVVNEDEENMSHPYHIFELMGINFNNYFIKTDNDNKKSDLEFREVKIPKSKNIYSIIDYKLFKYCRYRYVLDTLLSNGRTYNDRFLTLFNVENIVYAICINNKNSSGASLSELNSKAKGLLTLFPFMNTSERLEKQKKIEYRLEKDSKSNYSNTNRYIENKIMFTYNKLTKPKSKKDYLRYIKNLRTNEKKRSREINTYLNQETDISKLKVNDFIYCKYCNNRNICLFSYIEGY